MSFGALGSVLPSVVFGLSSAASWGIGDFSGGLASRSAPVRTVIVLSQGTGLILLVALALLVGEKFPIPADLMWGALAGIAGQVGLVALYRAMAIGQMGIAAPLTSVLAAAIPALFGALTQGAPAAVNLIGFALALAGVWLLARPEGETGQPAGLWLALLGGCGFGGFLVLIAQVHPSAVLWPVAAARVSSLLLQTVLALFARRFVLPSRAVMPWIISSGVMDAGGNAFFVLAEQAGRLDVASVLSSLYPATTVLLAVLILKERLTRVRQIGVLLALIAVPLIAAK